VVPIIVIDVRLVMLWHAGGGRVRVFFRKRCERIAERIRISVGATDRNASRGRLATTGSLWPRLVLWVIACSGLFLSLLLQPNEFDRESRLATRELVEAQRSRTSELPHSRRQKFWRSSSSSAALSSR
jgi:hypothetical protein